MQKSFFLIWLKLLLIIFTSCTSSNESELISNEINDNLINYSSDLVIGLESQPDEYQLGQPIRVRTDEDGNIYIADKASLTIKIFDKDGNYIKNLGGRGKEENKFHDFEFMEFTPEGHLVFMDRHQLRYSIITTDGEAVATYPYNMSKQFYPKSFVYTDSTMIALFLSMDLFSDPPPIFERDFFHEYDFEFQNSYESFFSYELLDINNIFAWTQMAVSPGSFTLSKQENHIFFSPGLYNSRLYLLKKNDDKWEIESSFRGKDTNQNSFKTYASKAEFEIEKELPGTMDMHYGPGAHYGRVYSIDAGIYQDEKGNNIVHFFGEWRGGDTTMDEGNLLEIDVQIFDRDLNITAHKHLFEVEVENLPRMPLVNWKDKDDNFYLIDTEDGIPVVRRFQLQLPES